MMWQISANIQNATFFTIMAGETADVSNKDQLVIYIRWVDDRFVVYKVFVGMHPLEKNKQSKKKNKAVTRHVSNKCCWQLGCLNLA